MRNQILSVDVSQGNKKKSSGNIEINKIVKFFAIILIIFSITCISVSGYAFVQNNNISIIGARPEVSVDKQNDDLLVTAKSKKGIDRITYSWNDDSDIKTLTEDGKTEAEELIELPVGSNTLKLTVYDINGKSMGYEKKYDVEAKAPQLSITGNNGKLKITAKDNEQMAYVTYRWDDGEETKIEVTEESSAQIEKEIEIPRGQHTITVIAVNKNNLTTEKSQEVKGVIKPIITVVQDSENLKYLIMSVSDEEAVKIINFTLNGKEYQIDLSNYKEKQIQYKIEMTEGENSLTVEATNFDGAKGTFEGTCTYTP